MSEVSAWHVGWMATLWAKGMASELQLCRNPIAAMPTLDESQLIERYLPLVRNVVDRIKVNLPPHVVGDDLYSAGVTGLVAAVRKFDPAQSVTFASYATMRIRGAILDELRQRDWAGREGAAWEGLLDNSTDATEPTEDRAVQLKVLTEKIAAMPDLQRKILQMYYFENLRLSEIAAACDLTETRICQIHAQSILSLRASLARL